LNERHSSLIAARIFILKVKIIFFLLLIDIYIDIYEGIFLSGIGGLFLPLPVAEAIFLDKLTRVFFLYAGMCWHKKKGYV
jgi:hypothetical protein